MIQYRIPKQKYYPVGIDKRHGVRLCGRKKRYLRLIYLKPGVLRPYILIKNGNKVYHTTLMRTLTRIIINRKIPDGVVCHHHCKRPWCVNPAHIVLSFNHTHNIVSSNKNKQIPPELSFVVADCLDTDFGGKCILIGKVKPDKNKWDDDTCVPGYIPDITRASNFDSKDWDLFIENGRREKDILASNGFSSEEKK